MIGPVISVLSFVCSIGNVPLAAVLWNGGISFGGVIAFIFADLIILPILVIYRKYYGTTMMLTILGIFYATMVAAGYIIEIVFGGARAHPRHPGGQRSPQTGITWNYTTILNIIFLLLAAALLVRFFRTGGAPMLKMMGGSPGGHEHHADPEPHGHEHGAAGTTGTRWERARATWSAFLPEAVVPQRQGAGSTPRA